MAHVATPNQAYATVAFDDGAVYERFMGRWSRAAGAIFLEWLAPPMGARWLDVGCGTGVFTELILDKCSPASVIAVDPAAAQIDYARKQPVAARADFRVADAQMLPYADGTFDLVVSALVMNFIPDRARALAEMRRVCRRGGGVAGYVWDFAADRGSGWPLQLAMRRIGTEPPRVPGADDTSTERLRSLFGQAGFESTSVRSIEVTVSFQDFDDYWTSQTPAFTPHGKVIASLPEMERARLIETVRRLLPAGKDGSIAYSARANAIKSRVPA